MQNSYGKGLAIHSAPSLALIPRGTQGSVDMIVPTATANNCARAVPKKLAGHEACHDVSVLDQTGRTQVGSINFVVRHMPDETMNL